MYQINDLERATGFTTSQVRDRLSLLGPILSDDLHRGKRGKVIVGDSILAALQRMAELEREGLAPRVARDRILGEIGNHHGNGATTVGAGPATSAGEVQALRARIEAQDKLIAWQQAQIEQLQSRVGELLPLALPAPRRSWLGRLVFGG